MTVYVVDAGVAVKWYVPETHSDFAAELLDEGAVLHAPDLLPSELGDVLWKKFRFGELTRSEVTSIVQALPLVPVRLHSSLLLLEAGLEIALDIACTARDSLYVALAVALDGTLITSDQRLLKALWESHLDSYAMHIGEL